MGLTKDPCLNCVVDNCESPNNLAIWLFFFIRDSISAVLEEKRVERSKGKSSNFSLVSVGN